MAFKTIRKNRDYIFIQGVQNFGNVHHEALHRTPLIYKRLGVQRHCFRHRIRVLAKSINNRENLARVVREHYGFGHFVLLFWSVTHKNKKFNPDFKCIGDNCKYKQGGRCRIYSRHKEGFSCKKNAKIKPSWAARARIIIEPTSNSFEKDFKFKWCPEADSMHSFSRWFWQGTSNTPITPLLTIPKGFVRNKPKHRWW